MVRASLPVGAGFARENFSGDPLVERFCEWAKDELKVEADIFVSWACPPDVSILTSPVANVLVRSERFDTLLVEYLHLKDAARHNNPVATGLVLPSAVLRWMSEFLLGYRWPQAALHAAMRAVELGTNRQSPNPFRDETLASIDEVQRTALQCFCLAHELGHLVRSQHDEISLDTLIDGRSLSQHITRDLEEVGTGHVTAARMMDIATGGIDAAVLLREIDADLIALELVAVFIANTFGVPAETAMQVSLSACEAQSFLYATKHTCLLLKRNAGRRESHADFSRDDWIAGTQVSVRARCLLRRAGILLSRWCAGDQPQNATTISRFVPVVDAMFLESSTFRAELAAVAQQEAENLLGTTLAWNGAAPFASMIEAARASPEIRLDLYNMLVAMGFPGGTNPIDWFEHLFGVQQA
jgi:hypothetical protein